MRPLLLALLLIPVLAFAETDQDQRFKQIEDAGRLTKDPIKFEAWLKAQPDVVSVRRELFSKSADINCVELHAVSLQLHGEKGFRNLSVCMDHKAAEEHRLAELKRLKEDKAKGPHQQ